MLCLGVESTAHTFSCSVVELANAKGKILSDARSVYKPPEGLAYIQEKLRGIMRSKVQMC